jgi:Asp-tRNA(Asn)/Glu-tRNA(Gln) amidotransferase A subunit family amidase
MPAWQIRDLIEKREVSPVEVTEHFLGRAEELDPILKCYRTLDPSGAREQAKRAEAAVSSGDELGLLHGIPVSVKEHGDEHLDHRPSGQRAAHLPRRERVS